MRRLVLDRLWPVLIALAVLVLGALALQEFARRRGNQTIRVVIQNERLLPSDEEDAAGAAAGDDGERLGAPLSELHAQARTAARRGHVKEALPLFEQALKEHPDSAELLGELGYWLMISRRPERALPLLERADQLRPSAQSAMRLGNVRRDLDDYAGAEREYRRALALRPSHVAAKISLGAVLRRSGETQAAIAILKEAVGSGSNEERSRAWTGLGWALLAARERPQAEKAFERAIELSPARAGVRLSIARAWQSTDADEDEVRARDVLERTAELAPDMPAVWYALGRAHERTGDRAAALEAYDRALRLDPKHRQARRRTVQLALLARDFPRARREAERLVADSPEDPESHLLEGTVAEKDGRRDDARRSYRAAIDAANGRYPEGWLALGDLDRAGGGPAAARQAYRNALKEKPDWTAAWLAMGKLEESLSDPAAAEKAWRRALALDPKYAPAWLALGQLHEDRGKVEDAVADLQHALAVKPGYGPAQLALGRALVSAGRAAEAQGVLRALVARDPRSVGGWHQLALALRASGDLAGSRGALAKAIALDATYLPARLELGAVELAGGRLSEAKAVLQEALDLAPGDLGVRASLAMVAARSGDAGACAEELHRLQRDAPGDPRVLSLVPVCGAARPAGNDGLGGVRRSP